MSKYIGILLAVTALFGWGFGDYFAQKTVRKIGAWKAVFLTGIVGFIMLLPFAWSSITNLESTSLILLLLLSTIAFFAALFNYEALRQGKIAIVEPLCGLELPLTVGLSIALGKEQLSRPQAAAIGLTLLGIIMAITIHHSHLHYHRRLVEKGVMLAGIGVIGMALTNYLVGTSSQQVSPLLTIWFMHTMLAVASGIYLITRGEFLALRTDLKKYPVPLLAQSILNNIAWIGFAIATTIIPISVATSISESYIALAVLLGIFLNHERLRTHQVIGIVFAIAGIIALSLVTA